MLRCVVYLSTANRQMSDDELLEILAVARENNTAFDVTGMLLYSDGNFIQALEGESEAVGALYRKIARDNRHHDVHTLIDETVDVRSFGQWSMGFYSARRSELAAIPGFSGFMDPERRYEDVLAEGDALEMLKMFRSNTQRG